VTNQCNYCMDRAEGVGFTKNLVLPELERLILNGNTSRVSNVAVSMRQILPVFVNSLSSHFVMKRFDLPP